MVLFICIVVYTKSRIVYTYVYFVYNVHVSGSLQTFYFDTYILLCMASEPTTEPGASAAPQRGLIRISNTQDSALARVQPVGQIQHVQAHPAPAPFPRASFPMLFMAAAELFASRSTCQRLKTAALIVRDQNIISIGYNGVVRGDTHCDAYWFALYQEKRVGHSYPTFYSFSKSDEFYQLHHPWSTAHEIHGEQNAILQAHTDLRGAAIYSLYAPCIHCAKAIVTAGLTHLYYRHVYTRDVSGLDFCISRGIACQQIGDPVAS